MALFGGPKTGIGLDIGAESIRVVELKPGKGLPRLQKLGAIKIPHGLIVDGEISDTDEVGKLIKELWKKTGIVNKGVTIGIANTKVLARQVELPYMEPDALKGAIRFQAQEYIPIPPQNLVLDYHVVGESVGDNQQRMLKVLLVAAHEDMIDSFVRCVEKAGLNPEVVYLSSLALVRSLGNPPGSKPVLAAESEESDEILMTEEPPLVIVNMGARLSTVVVALGDITQFSRVITFGGEDLTKALQDGLGVPVEEAEELKVKYGLVNPLQDSTEEIDETQTRVNTVLQTEAYRFVDEVRRSVEYYFSQDISSLNINEVVMCGGAAQLSHLTSFVSEALNVDVRLGDPLARVVVDEKLKTKGIFDELAPVTLAAAVGLGLRGLSK